MATVSEKYQTLVELAPDPIFLLDTPEGTIAEVNQRAVDLLGYDRTTLVGMTVTEIHPESQREEYRALLEQTLEHGQMRTGDLTEGTQLYLVSKDGSEIPVEIHASTIAVDGRVSVFAVVRDITERNERNAELNRKNERLEQFTSVVSHDLRNPLNVAQLQLDVARRERDSEALASVASALERMETLINDLLTLAKHDKTVETTESVNVGHLAEQCWTNIETHDAVIQTDVSYSIRADRPRLTQLLENLIRNAVEHNSETVSITVGTLADETGFYVEDDGRGIEDDATEMVFETGYTTEDDGTGFGLNIVERIVEAHGWDIAVVDGHKGGARFEITGVESGAE